jgi:pyruvate formate lyase activating enzyme
LADEAKPQDIALAAKRSGCRSVAYTYNDPVIFLEYALEVAEACRDEGIRSVAVTAGYISPLAAREFFAGMDAANVDLKAFTDSFYQRHCSGSLSSVLDTLTYLVHQTDCWVEITTLLIPGENDSDDELIALARWLARNLGAHIPLHFTAFHPDFKMRDRPATPKSTLIRARQIAIGEGLQHVYVGNVRDTACQSTYCHGCGSRIIGRDAYCLSSWELTETGSCLRCGTPCPGVFDGPPGDWGARRQRLKINTNNPQRLS